MTQIHHLSDVQSRQIGENTRIWQFSVVLEKAIIGRDCNICAHVFIENDVIIGDRVILKNGVQLWDGTRIADDVFIGPYVSFTNDHFPRSGKPMNSYPLTTVAEGASIGANSTILPGLTIGRYAMVAAGAVVTRDVPAYAIVKGNPARIDGYVQKREIDASKMISNSPVSSAMEGVAVIPLKMNGDLRGDLLAMELGQIVPFPLKRVFHVMNVPSNHLRGEHAHRECHQMLICLKGSVILTVNNGSEQQEWLLNRPDFGIHIQPMIWAAQWQYSSDAVLMVFASHSYDPDDYIRDFEEYLRILKRS